VPGFFERFCGGVEGEVRQIGIDVLDPVDPQIANAETTNRALVRPPDVRRASCHVDEQLDARANELPETVVVAHLAREKDRCAGHLPDRPDDRVGPTGNRRTAARARDLGRREPASTAVTVEGNRHDSTLAIAQLALFFRASHFRHRNRLSDSVSDTSV